MLKLEIQENDTVTNLTISKQKIQFVMDYEDCSYEEAINYITEKARRKIKKVHKKMKRQKAKKNFMLSGHPHAKIVYENRFREKTITKYYLNVECTQFTIGKTGKTLGRVGISNAAKLHSASINSNQNEKVISIIITSCSLAETKQWNVRANKKFGKVLNICTISSKTKKTNTGSGNSIRDFTFALTFANNNNLPDILIMCAHSIRVKKDLLALLMTQKRISYENGKKFKFNLFFDEADKNIRLITDSLKKIRTQRDEETGHTMDTYLNEVHFITATPTAPFWGALHKIGINELANFDIEFGTEIDDAFRTRAREQYQSILTHPHIDFTSSGSANALENIRMVMQSEHIPPIGNGIQNIIFAPAENTRVSHNEVKEYFQENGYYVFIHNGKEKGIYDPSDKFKSLDELNIEYDLDPKNTEVRDTLRKWQVKNPSSSLGITGWYTITRGLTFNTNGFNFTHMIFCWIHARNLAEFVQLLGRCCGDSKFCDPIKLIGPKGAFDNAKDFVQNLLDLKDENVTEYNEKQFKKNKANEAIVYHEFPGQLGWMDAVKKIKEIWPRRNPYKIGRKDECKPMPDDNGFYHNNIRGQTSIMSLKYVLDNRCCAINKNSPYRIHCGYKNVKNKDTCVWIACYRKEDEPKKEEKVSVMDAFNK